MRGPTTYPIDVRGASISRDESLRLHEDWWGKCWTCRFWTADMSGTDDVKARAWERVARCSNAKSQMVNVVMDTDGHCGQWDSWDVDMALRVIYSPTPVQAPVIYSVVDDELMIREVFEK